MNDGSVRAAQQDDGRSAAWVALASRLPEPARRWLASAVHGDWLDALAARLRDLGARGTTASVPFGSVLRPLTAEVVEDFDSHEHARAVAATISRALDEADVEHVCSPPISGRARQVAVDATAVDDVATALASRLVGGGWCVSNLSGDGAVEGRPVALTDRRWRTWLHGNGIRVFKAVAAADGTVLGTADLGCDVQAWRRVEHDAPRPDEGVLLAGTRVAPTPNGWATFLPPASWADGTSRPDRIPVPVRHPGPFDVTDPVDIVLTWVDAADPAWQRRRDAAQPAPGGHHPGGLDPARFDSADELRYALRSIHYYASWARQVYVVTGGQHPSWLDPAHPGVRVVDHTEIFPPGTPYVFNSHAIESRLHHIPGLAQRYLYLNDDVMFGRRAYPEDFYVGNQVLRFGVSNHLLDPSPAAVTDPAIMSAAKNGRDLVEQQFGRTIRAKVRHGAHPQLRDVAEQMEREHPEAFEQVASSVFRSHEDISVPASLQMWYAAATGRGVPAAVDLLFLDIGAPEAPRTMRALLRTRKHRVFCLNTSRVGPGRARDVAELRRFLDSYFPIPAPWEITPR